MIKKLLKHIIINAYPFTPLISKIKSKNEPYLCIITPVFDNALGSLELLVSDLKKQSLGNFIHISISNGSSAKIKRYILKLRKKDKRFIYDEIQKETITNYESLLINLGKRRRYSLQKYNAQRYFFMDCDLKLLDNNYFSKLHLADVFFRKDVIVTDIIHSGRVTSFPTDFDMANFSFSKRVAKTHPYFIDLDPQYGRGNDYRYFVSINTPTNTLFLNFISAEKDGNNRYIRSTDIFYQEKIADKMIPIFGNSFKDKDFQSVIDVLKSHLVGTGNIVEEFEERFKHHIGFKYAVATNSCTNAFWLLFKALEFKKNDEIIIPNIHFFGVKNVLEMFDIKYKTADVGALVPNITLASLKKNINANTKAIIFLEYGGYPVEIDKIKSYLQKIGRGDILLILDAANSPFTVFKETYTAINYDFSLYSFDINKIIVTGDGGMILSNKRKIMQRIKSLSVYGIIDTNKTGFEKSKKEGGMWWYVHDTIPSIKLSMNNIEASLGLSQLEQLHEILDKRQLIKETYNERLQPLVDKKKIAIPPVYTHTQNNLYYYWIILTDEKIRNKLAQYLLKKNVYTTVKYQPLDMSANTPNALNFYKTALLLPFNQNLTETHIAYIIEQLITFFKA